MKSSMSELGKATTARNHNGLVARAAILCAVLFCCASIASAQVYGVARKTTVVSGPNGTVAASKTTVVGANGSASKTTVVATGHPANKTTVVVANGGMPHGYIAVIPTGYRTVYVSGVRYYTVGGIYYRPQMYQGRTVYVAVRL